MQTITPVLLCGGAGTRLWPLSRTSYPKQFAALFGDESLFQRTACRLSGVQFAAPLVITHADFRFIVTEQLAATGIDPGPILLEPEGRNTAPAILAAALHLGAMNPDQLMLISPSDQVIPDASAFRAAVAEGAAAAMAGDLVVFGITPDRAETGFGYLETAVDSGLGRVQRFIEKPQIAQAEQMLASGGYLWNAGMILCTPRAMIAALGAHAPQLVAPVRAALTGARADLGFLRLARAPWAEAEAISIDYAVMEHARNLSVVRFTGRWSDLGSWEAVWREASPDVAGVATIGPAQALGCRNTLLHAEDDGQVLIGIGLAGILVVATPDAVLVADRSRAQDVRRAVDVLRLTGAAQADSFALRHQAWGTVETLVSGAGFMVQRVILHPGGTLGVQGVPGRAETWRLVSGVARVLQGGSWHHIEPRQSVEITSSGLVQIDNGGDFPVVWIVVQIGDDLSAQGICGPQMAEFSAEAAPSLMG